MLRIRHENRRKKKKEYIKCSVCTSKSTMATGGFEKTTNWDELAVIADKDVAAETPDSTLRESQQKGRKIFSEQVHRFRPENL